MKKAAYLQCQQVLLEPVLLDVTRDFTKGAQSNIRDSLDLNCEYAAAVAGT